MAITFPIKITCKTRFLRIRWRYRLLRSEGRTGLTINRLDGQRVLVVLGGKDMSDFALDFEEMDMENAHARKILLRLTRLACRKTGISLSGKRVHIEALTVGEGCYLLVTVQRRSRRYRLKRSGSCCWQFQDVTAFLGAAEALCRLPYRLAKNAAYTLGGAYYLLFGYPAVPKALRHVLGEFAEAKGGALKCAQVREQGRVICAQNAVATIGEYLI